MKSILITGASRGTGRATAIKCARSGHFNKIILNCYKNESALEETKLLCENADSNISIYTTVGDVGNLIYIEEIRKSFGSVDVIINNAALSYVGLLIDMTPDEWSTLINTNITSIYNTCHTFVPDMIQRKQGHIINISSVWGRIGASCEVAYSASKGAVDSFTKSLAKELAPSGVQVNAISFGIIDTDMNACFSDDEKAEICDDIPVGRMATADEAAQAILKLLEMPHYFTGEVLRFDGGWF